MVRRFNFGDVISEETANLKLVQDNSGFFLRSANAEVKTLGLTDVKVVEDKPWIIDDPRINPEWGQQFTGMSSVELREDYNKFLENIEKSETYQIHERTFFFYPFVQHKTEYFLSVKNLIEHQWENGLPHVLSFFFPEKPFKVSSMKKKLYNPTGSFISPAVSVAKFPAYSGYTTHYYYDILSRKLIGNNLYGVVSKRVTELGIPDNIFYNVSLFAKHYPYEFRTLSDIAETLGYSWYGEMWNRVAHLPDATIIALAEWLGIFNSMDTIYDLKPITLKLYFDNFTPEDNADYQ